MTKPLQFPRGSAAHTLLVQLTSCLQDPGQLKTVHDLALYDSGDALLGPDEKEALLNVNELRLRMEQLSDEERAVFMDAL